MADIPGVDGELRVESAGGGMEAAFRRRLLQLEVEREVIKVGGGGGKSKEGNGNGKGNRDGEERKEEKEKAKKGWVLIMAAYQANKWQFWSAVPPRLALLGFSLCQPFLIEAVVGYLASREQKMEGEDDEIEAPQPAYYGRALVGGFVLLYIGIAVSRICCYDTL